MLAAWNVKGKTTFFRLYLYPELNVGHAFSIDLTLEHCDGLLFCICSVVLRLGMRSSLTEQQG